MKKLIFYSLIMVMILGQAGEVRAADYILLEPLPVIQGTGQSGDCVKNNTLTCINLQTYIGYVFKFAIALAVFLASIVLIYGGFEYMLSASSFTKIDAAKTRMKNAVIGLLGALASYLILYTIDPRLVQINTSISKIDIKITQETAGFQSQVAHDVNSLSREAIDKNAASEAKIQALRKERAELEANLPISGEILSPEELRIAHIDEEIKNEQVIQQKANTSGFGAIKLEDAFRAISTKENATIINGFENDIKTGLYQSKVDALAKLDPAAGQEAKVAGEFYVNEIEKQKKYAEVLDAYITNKNNVSNKANVEKLLAEYNNPSLNDKYPVYRKYPEIVKQYNTLNASRVNAISQTLGIPYVPPPAPAPAPVPAP